jgi:VWFA-related protein
VRGLKASDFILRDRDKPQTIAAFEEITHERPTATGEPLLNSPPRLDVANNATARSERLVVLVIDDLHIYKGRSERARTIARDVVSKLGPQASMAVLFTSRRQNTQVTDDRAVLLEAIDTLDGKQSVRRPNQARDDQTAPPGDAGQDPLARLDQIGKAQEVSLQQFFENLTQYKTLEDAARVLGADDSRRKAFVLISEGIGKDLTGVFERRVTPCEAQCPYCPCHHENALGQMMESLRRSNVTTYAIDPRGRVSAQDLATEGFPNPASGLGDDPATGGFRWNNPIRLAQDGLTLMAEATGGFAVTDSNDFSGGLERIIEALDHYYLLGFHPSDPGRTGFWAGFARAAGAGSDYRPLDVEVQGRSDLVVRFRKGYRPGGPPKAPVNQDPLAALSAGVLPKPELPLKLFAAVVPGDRKDAHVLAAIEITAPTNRLVGADRKLRDQVSYGILVVDEKKTKVTSRSRVASRIVLSPRTGGPDMPETVSYQIPVSITLPPGRYQLRASATSTTLARGGSVYLSIDVPDFSKAPLAIAGLTVGYANGDHVAVADVPRERVARQRGAPFAPSLDRRFTSTDILRLYFEATRASGSTDLQSKVSIIDASDETRAWVDRTIKTGNSGKVDVKLPLSTLASGAYRLRVTVSNGAADVTRDVGFVVK